ncbi:unnamed protein product [Gongylonema pulchrum]|uniref:CN hydrolase domain-containing protein n=1 Tax=Gongylonema pulchrum TaxID=637853 RepID=A0A183DRF2_9BILA|nr:unnamed protein product [Gongylonema pulchrum]
MVFFPECFDYVGRNREENEALAMAEGGEYIGRYRSCAKQYGLWLSLGGFHEKDPAGQRKPFNTHLIINDSGETCGIYRKLHLFDVDIPGKIAAPVNTPVGNVAMSICYDLRFAELALWHRMKGAHILTYPAAFTVNTGLAHWEVSFLCVLCKNSSLEAKIPESCSCPRLNFFRWEPLTASHSLQLSAPP